MAQFGASSATWVRPVSALNPGLGIGNLGQPQLVTSLAQPLMATALSQPHLAAALSQPHMVTALSQPPHMTSPLGGPPVSLTTLAASQPQLATTVASLLSASGLAAPPTFYSTLAVSAPPPPQQGSSYHSHLAAAAAAAAAAHTQYQTQQLAAQVSFTAQQLAAAAAASPVSQYGAQQIAVTSIGQPGIALPTTLSSSTLTAITYPGATRGAQLVGPAIVTSTPSLQLHPPQPIQKQRVFTGAVTKINDTFGFVDEDVFFQTNVCKGSLPKVGDRVLVEAVYNGNMPFKWNASRIQVFPNQPALQQHAALQQQQQQQQHAQTAMAAAAAAAAAVAAAAQIQPLVTAQHHHLPQHQHQLQQHQLQQHQLQHQQHQQPGVGVSSPLAIPGVMQYSGMVSRFAPVTTVTIATPPSGRTLDAKARFERDRERFRPAAREREKRSPLRRSHSPPPLAGSRRPALTAARASCSPPTPPRKRMSPRRKPRASSRYAVHVPKLSLDQKSCSVVDIWSRYHNLYIPSDFMLVQNRWTEAFPLHRPCRVDQPVSFHIMSKEVEPLEPNDAILDAADADHRYSAKVMLLSPPPIDELYHKSCSLAEDPESVRDNFQHPSRLMQFLVGLRGSRAEPLAIGGAWSPSLDGADPATDPRVLVRTAIRTTKALTGIDLASCTQWYRFTEINYQRMEELHKGKIVPAHIETVVIFLPDVWNCVPTMLEWHATLAAYKKHLQAAAAAAARPSTGRPAAPKDDTMQDEAEEEMAGEPQGDGGDEEEEAETASATAIDNDDSEYAKVDPAHHSVLDPKTMKVGDLRTELEARSLSSKGLKSQLVARLAKSLKAERLREDEEKEALCREEATRQEKALAHCSSIADSEVALGKKRKGLDVEQVDSSAERDHSLPAAQQQDKNGLAAALDVLASSTPHIIVHPRRSAKGGKFECGLMSLSVLLDYRPEDKKEHSFEISLFAESFNEMLMRDFGFIIYKRLLAVPEHLEDERRKDDRDVDRRRDEDPVPKRRRTEDDDSDLDENNGKEEEEKNDKKKGCSTSRSGGEAKNPYTTVDKEALLAFVYFDTGHAGYLLEKDAEEILHTLGLQLSRSQVKRVVQKLVTRDMLNYRRITDKCNGRSDGVTLDFSLADTKLKSSFGLSWLGQAQHSSVGACGLSAALHDRPERGDSDDLLVYKGSLLDVPSLYSKLSKSELARSELEHKLRSLLAELDLVKDRLEKSDESCESLSVKLSRASLRLEELTKAGEGAEATVRYCRSALSKSKGSLECLLADIESAIAVTTSSTTAVAEGSRLPSEASAASSSGRP